MGQWEIDYHFVLGVLGANAASIDQFVHIRRTSSELVSPLLDREPAGPDVARRLLGLALT
jgi:hypothetical protein